ncbi:hypothetical protein [Gordonia sp. (in: high G+C Gram-positive bacteria)]|uniref:hypothetical protein n=1 Tax=Gordonia sp. (in: high G+C Gram-positive bacteria) TaxID=84139 RepID=UPI003C76EB8B
MTPAPVHLLARDVPASNHPAASANSRTGSIDSGFSRRAVLRGGAVIGVAAMAGWSLTACNTGPTQRELDAQMLLPHAQAAFAQQRAATELSPRITEYVNALKTVADQRGQHLQALRDEINRLDSSTADQIEAGSPAPTASIEALRTAIAASARSANRACVTSSGFTAGLLGSISASCQTLQKVQLA